MNIIEEGKAFVQSLLELGQRSRISWRECPYCGSKLTCKYGTYTKKVWTLRGREKVKVQRHKCHSCDKTYREESPRWVARSQYGRAIHRLGIDHWLHMGSSLRRTAELLRSLLGEQERWCMWHPWEKMVAQREECHLSASTIQRWLRRSGEAARRRIGGQFEEIPLSGQMGADGLWARLRGGAKRVVLMLVDSVSGLVLPPVVVAGESSKRFWREMFDRAQEAGLDLEALRGVTSDGAKALIGCLKEVAGWANHQSCVWHLWRNVSREIRKIVTAHVKQLGYAEELARAKEQELREELHHMVRTLLDAPSFRQAEIALADLNAHPQGQILVRKLAKPLDDALMYLSEFNQGLVRVGPEWCWRDFRLRLSRGRNHGSDARLEATALLWATYHNFTPAQYRSERKRKYRRPGLSPLQMAGASPENISYLDALAV